MVVGCDFAFCDVLCCVLVGFGGGCLVTWICILLWLVFGCLCFVCFGYVSVCCGLWLLVYVAVCLFDSVV